ncbi:uncharacterized protein LOC116212839 [Punica granatum]|uniref:Uncharacterized protein LOC116212839 n=1 Tax=Punica granatum TaxID=22663 RepID=A0A218XLZ3_PUNGR|nr:uncharacterized protein LOC116212839 [Punica granatum]OWM85914.1 hypothetical protein CDL15_Pgr012164 [Punica granatum]
MASIKSKIVMVSVVMTILMLSPIWSVSADEQPNIGQSDWCRMLCALKCYPVTSPLQPCMLGCMKGCLGNSLAINNCNLGCAITSCLKPNADMKSLEGCVGSCSKDCGAS